MTSAVAFYAVLIPQIVVPAISLRQDSLERFGWQMFVDVRADPTYQAEYEDGHAEAIDVGNFVANPRGDIDLASVLPLHICRHLDDVVAVTVIWTESADGRVKHVCS